MSLQAGRNGTSSAAKILFVAHSAFRGGAEFCLDSLLHGLPQDRYEITVIFPWEGPMVDSVRAIGSQAVVRPLSWWIYWGFSVRNVKSLLIRTAPNICWLVSFIRRHRFDLVYSNTAAIFEAAIAARIAGVPHIWHVHEVLERGNVSASVLPLPWIKKLISGLADRVIFESAASRDAYQLDGHQDKYLVVHNCVRFREQLSAGNGAAARRQLGISQGDQVVAFIGQFLERKNPLLLVRALARMPDRSRFRCLFVGAGPLQDRLVREIERLHLADCCRLLPFQDDITPVLNALDVLVLPSRQESFGLVIVEAAAFGKPAIATRSEGPGEIILDGETGYLVRQDDEEDLARALVDIFSSKSQRVRMGQAAARRARERFSASEYARKIGKIIDDTLTVRFGKHE